MKKLFFIFDQLPKRTDGGLITSYLNLNDLLKDKYEIEIISIFNYEENNDVFLDNRIHIINKNKIDIRFYRIFSYLKKLNFKKFFNSFKSILIYFFSINKNRNKVNKLINDKDLVIVSCPSAGIFMPKNKKFILEIHTDYKYFFGTNLVGKLQGKMMSKPTLTLFRTKYDSIHAPKYLNPKYIYNFYDKNEKDLKTKLENSICFVGRLEKEKNPLRLIEICIELKKINNDFKLDIYGDGTLFNDIKEAITNNNLEKNIELKGFTKNKNIYSKYKLLCVTSSLEGFGMNIIEAKSYKVPTISTKWSNSVYEVINDNIDGFIIDDNKKYAKKINEVLCNKELQKKLSENAFNDYKRFSKEEAKKKWIKILDEYKK